MKLEMYTVGATIYVRHDLGDFVNGRSIVVPAGTPAKLVEFFDRDDGHGCVTRGVARIHVPGSERGVYTCHQDDLAACWTTRKPG